MPIGFVLVVCLAGVLLVGYFRLGWNRGKDEAREVVAAAVPVAARPELPPTLRAEAPPSAAQEAQAASSLGFVAGQRLVYDFLQSRDLEMRMRQPGQHPGAPAFYQEMRMSLTQRGRLIVEVLAELREETRNTGWLMEFRWVDPSVEMLFPGMFDPEQERQMREARRILESEITGGMILASMNPTGRLEDMRAVSLDSEEARNHWRDILARWQVILSDDPSARDWMTSEQDSTGVFRAHYRRVASDRPGERLVKRKVRYTEITEQREGRAELAGKQPSSSVQGETVIVLAPFQQSIAGDELVNLKEAATLDVKSYSTFRFNLVNQDKQALGSVLDASATAAWLAAAGDSVGWENRLDPRRIRRDPPPKPADMDLLVDQLQRLHALGGAESQAEVNLAMRLIEGVRAGGEPAVDQLLDCLTETDGYDPLSAVLAGVLGAVDTPEAHRGLLEVVADEAWPLGVRHRALEACLQTTRPVPEADPLFIRLYEEGGPLADTALLMLGITGDYTRHDAPERYEAINRYVEDQVARIFPDKPSVAPGEKERTGQHQDEQAATESHDTDHMPLKGDEQDGEDEEDNAQVLLLLATIGNLGPPEVPPFVVHHASHPEPHIRVHAVLAVERIFTPEADEIILEAMHNDEDERVRVTALQTLATPDREGTLPTLIEIALNDPAPSMRTAALAGLASLWSEEDEAIQAVRTMVNNDASEDVRTYAQQWLDIHAPEGDVSP